MTKGVATEKSEELKTLMQPLLSQPYMFKGQ